MSRTISRKRVFPIIAGRLILGCFALLAMGLATPAFALFTPAAFSNSPLCDPLAGPPVVDELGTLLPIFLPGDQVISAADTATFTPVCPTDDPLAPDALVTMTNFTLKTFVEVWYVADPNETLFSNIDGFINGGEGFRIDNVVSDPLGIHHPLVFESVAFDGIWVPGETWDFVIQDYFNFLGNPPSAFTSGGIGAASVPSAVGGSSGSIIAVVPEPGSVLLLGTGLVALAWVRRRRSTNG